VRGCLEVLGIGGQQRALLMLGLAAGEEGGSLTI
jgi:hypothetical protein